MMTSSACGRLELLEIDRAVIVRIGGFELLLDDSEILFLVLGSAALISASVSRPSSSLASSAV